MKKKGYLEEYLNKVLPNDFEKNILDTKLNIKKKVYKTFIKAGLEKKELDKIYLDFIKKYKKKIEDLEEEKENIKDFDKKSRKKKRQEFIYFIFDTREILKTNEELLKEFNNDVKNISRDKDNRMNLLETNEVFKKWKNIILEKNKETQKSFLEEAKNGNLLKMNLENALKYEKIQEIRNDEKLKGKKYVWMRTTAKVPDEYHLELVGKVFDIGEGDRYGNMPGERYGCKCDFKILEG